MSDELRVHDIGEFGLISRLVEALPAEVRVASGVAVGIGDDAAVWEPTSGERIVLTTDSLVEGVHFRRDWTDWESLGHKSLAVNISDLAAMGADPKLAVITLELGGTERVSDLEALYRGVGEIARRYGVTIAGGDIVRSPNQLAIHVSALGETRNRRVLTRSGATVGDTIGVTGTLGASAAGLRLLEQDGRHLRRHAATADQLVDAHLRPEPRVALGAVLLEHGATAAMDLSDGLMGDLPKILAASQVSARLDERKVPVAAAVRALFPEEWLDLALRGGEDYELLFTAPGPSWEAIVHAARDVGGEVTQIGETVPLNSDLPTLEVVGLDGRLRTEFPGAFDHFSAKSN